MDVELLSKMISELIADNDYVGLPGVGTFVAEVVPATFSDKGYTINPPYRRLSFHPSLGESELLVDYYAKLNSISIDEAKLLVLRFLSELCSVLKDRKTIVLPSLGRLRATRENNFFFVADPDLDIYPEGFALESISLRSHSDNSAPTPIPFEYSDQEEAKSADEAAEPEEDEEVLFVFADEHLANAEPEAELPQEEIPMVEEELEEQTSQEMDDAAESESHELEAELPQEKVEETVACEEQKETDEEELTQKTPATKKRFRWWMPVLVLLFIGIMAMLVFITLVQVAPDLVDTLLYTPEELKIINY